MPRTRPPNPGKTASREAKLRLPVLAKRLRQTHYVRKEWEESEKRSWEKSKQETRAVWRAKERRESPKISAIRERETRLIRAMNPDLIFVKSLAHSLDKDLKTTSQVDLPPV